MPTEEHVDAKTVKVAADSVSNDAQTLKHLVWGMVALLGVVLVIVLALEIQVQSRNADLRHVRSDVVKLQKAADQTLTAAQSAERVLTDAVKSSQDSGRNAEVDEAFKSIHRIEEKVDALQR